MIITDQQLRRIIREALLKEQDATEQQVAVAQKLVRGAVENLGIEELQTSLQAGGDVFKKTLLQQFATAIKNLSGG